MSEKSTSADGIPRQYLENWLGRLRYCDDEISSIATGTEGSFLFIGERIRDFLDRATRISENAFSAVSMVSAEKIVKPIVRLNGQLKKLEVHLSHSENESKRHETKLKKILKSADGVLTNLNDFSGTTKNIDSLGNSLKLEDARDASSGDLKALSDDIESLIGTIRSKATNIQDDLNSLRNIIGQTLSKIFSADDEHQTRSSQVLKDAAASLCALTSKYDLSSAVTDGISERSSGVSTSINEVVVSLQFHDLTRQQLERVREAIGRFIGMLEAEIEGEKDRSGAQLAKEAYEFCGLQIVRLTRARDEFVSAVAAVKDNLISISSNISQISEETRNIVDDTAAGSSTFLSWIKQTLSSVSSAFMVLTEKTEAQRELSLSLSSVVGSTSEYIKEIEDIGDDIENISHKSGAKESQIGVKSGVIYVLVESVQRMSSQSVAFTDSLSGLLSSVSSFVKELSTGLGPDAVLENPEIQEIQKNLDALINTLRILNSDVRTLLIEVDNSAVNLLEEIEEASERINVHNTLSTVVGEIISELENIAADSCSIIPSSLMSDKPHEPLKSVEAKDVLQDDSGREEIKIRNEFGDNVELF
jgi:ABC-type transporter Mla subunit MlaD